MLYFTYIQVDACIFFSMNYIKLIIFDCFLSITMVILYDPTNTHTHTNIHAHSFFLMQHIFFISGGPARWIRSTQICCKERQTLKITLILC